MVYGIIRRYWRITVRREGFSMNAEPIAPKPRDNYEGLYSALNTLPAKVSEILKERFIDGRTLREIGRRYNCSHQRIDNILHWGLMQLRKPDRIYMVIDDAQESKCPEYLRPKRGEYKS